MPIFQLVFCDSLMTRVPIRSPAQTSVKTPELAGVFGLLAILARWLAGWGTGENLVCFPVLAPLGWACNRDTAGFPQFAPWLQHR